MNGRFAPALSTTAALPDGVRVMKLAGAWREMPELLERHLTRIAAFDEHSFTALNTAFMHDGAVVHVAKDAQSRTPIHLLFVGDRDRRARGAASAQPDRRRATRERAR